MRRLVLAADLSLDGFVGRDGLDPDWAREYDDDELVRYRRRVVLKAGVHALEEALERRRPRRAEGRRWRPTSWRRSSPRAVRRLPGADPRGLVDEYRITVHPVVFGDGYRLFAAPTGCYLISTRTSHGSVAHIYVPERAYRDHRPVPVGATAGAGRGRGRRRSPARGSRRGPSPRLTGRGRLLGQLTALAGARRRRLARGGLGRGQGGRRAAPSPGVRRRAARSAAPARAVPPTRRRSCRPRATAIPSPCCWSGRPNRPTSTSSGQE